jgi:probable HAF family extracellular repeat protein
VGQKKTKGKDDDEAFIWTKAGGIESLSTAFPNDFSSDALGISTDGSVVVGFHQDSGGNPQAYRWTKAGGLNNLGYLPGAGKSKTPLLELILLNPTTVLPSLLTPWALELALESRAPKSTMPPPDVQRKALRRPFVFVLYPTTIFPSPLTLLAYEPSRYTWIHAINEPRNFSY